MNIVFMGTPEFAIPSLTMLIASDNTITGVVTQPDRPKGRGNKLHPSPVKSLALQHGLPVLQPEKVKEENFILWLKNTHPDLIIVVAFGQLLPPNILTIPSYGCINLHASLLPAYRGAAPIHWALINGEVVTGVTTIRMNEVLDAGDILIQRSTPIDPEDDALTLSNRLSILGAKVLLETISELKRGALQAKPQNHSRASFAPALKKEHGQIEWQRSAYDLHNQIRGTLPWPGAFTSLNKKRLKIFKSKVITEKITEPPGTILETSAAGIKVATGQGALLLTDLQLQDHRRMSAAEFIRGHPLPKGMKLGA